MPPPSSLPKKKLVGGVWFTSEDVVAKGRQAVVKWRCQHPRCPNPMMSHSTNLSRHVRVRHGEDYKAFQTTGAVVAIPTAHEEQAHANQSCHPNTLGTGHSCDVFQEDTPRSDEQMMTGREASPQVHSQSTHQQVQPFHTLCSLMLALSHTLWLWLIPSESSYNRIFISLLLRRRHGLGLRSCSSHQCTYACLGHRDCLL
jgi:hypothetical protein